MSILREATYIAACGKTGHDELIEQAIVALPDDILMLASRQCQSFMREGYAHDVEGPAIAAVMIYGWALINTHLNRVMTNPTD